MRILLLFCLIVLISVSFASADYTGTSYINGSASLNDSVSLGYTAYIDSIEVDITNYATVSKIADGNIMSKAKAIDLETTGTIALVNVTYDSDMQSDFDDLRVVSTNGSLIDIMHTGEVAGEYSNLYFNATEDIDYYLVYGNATASRMNTTLTINTSDDVQIDSTSVTSGSLDYYLTQTTVHPAADYGYDLYQTYAQFDIYGGQNTITYHYKITCSVNGGAEETLLETSFSDKYTTNRAQYFDVEKHVEAGQNLTVYAYVERVSAYSGYTVNTRNFQTYAHKNSPVATLESEMTLPDKYEIGISANDGSDSESFDYGETKTLTIYPTGLISDFSFVSGSLDYLYDAEINYIWTEPNPTNVIVSPDVKNVANGTIYQANVYWEDSDLDYAEFYVDYGDGSGYVLEDSINFSSTAEWFNASIDTSGYLGNNISWYQTAYNEAGHSYTYYSDLFFIILDQLSVYVFDESSGDSILPDQVRIYNTESSHFASINSSTNVSTLGYSDVETGKYIVSVTKDGYYSRNSIIGVDITTLSELNMYLIDENQTVIYDQFALTDYLKIYDYIDCIIRLDKPFENGTETVYSSYFDYNGIAATYLIASDQYLLYIITPDRTISYGWLTPDSDGEISIVINEFEFEDLEDWLQYSYEESDSSVTFEYESSKALESATFAINNGTEIYNSTISTDTGSFTYLFEGNGTYQISISVLTEDGYEYVYKSVREIGQSQDVEFFPDSYSIVLKSLIVMFFIVVGVLGLSAFRADLAGIYAASLYAFSVYQDWCSGNEYTVSVVGILAIAAIVKFHRKNNRSLN